MTERPDAFVFFGPQTLVGPELKVGDPSPAFELTVSGLKPLSSEQFAGKPLVISVVPSLDTNVCSMQTKRFDEESAKLGDAVNFLTVSVDLPFAQKRYCGMEDVTHVTVASDYRDVNFGTAYGTLIKGARILSRAAFVVDAKGIIQYAEYVPAAGEQPNYDAILEVVRGLAE